MGWILKASDDLDYPDYTSIQLLPHDRLESGLYLVAHAMDNTGLVVRILILPVIEDGGLLLVCAGWDESGQSLIHRASGGEVCIHHRFYDEIVGWIGRLGE